MNRRRYLPALFLLFIGSGCAALIYEIVWFQLLQLVIGSSAISLGILLGTFMGGMCLGSLAAAADDLRAPASAARLRRARSRHRPVRAADPRRHAAGRRSLHRVGGRRHRGIILRAIAAGICLLPPTVMMGATLPAISRWVKATPEGVSWLGFFYGGNIAGGVLGSLAAGFYLLREHDVMVATLVGVAINAAVALIAYVLAGRTNTGRTPVAVRGVTARGTASVYVAIGLSGMTALAAEVIWTRLLSLHFGATVYTFSLILAVFLLDSASAARLAPCSRATSRMRAARWAGASCCCAARWRGPPTSSPSRCRTGRSTRTSRRRRGSRCSSIWSVLWVVLPGAILWGASFPLALVGRRDHRAGRGVAGRRRLRRQHRRRHRRLAGDELRPRAVDSAARTPSRC
jgi:spermidine synthase